LTWKLTVYVFEGFFLGKKKIKIGFSENHV